MRIVEVVPYNPHWNEQFALEAVKIKPIVSESLITMHHIGSTAIAGIWAKPILDFLIEVHNIKHVDNFNSALQVLRYKPFGENGIPGRRFFAKGGDKRTHHLHFFETGHPEIQRHLDFRDYLATHPAEAQAYSQLKQKLAHQFPADIKRYIVGKASFIKTVNEQAERWRTKTVVNSRRKRP